MDSTVLRRNCNGGNADHSVEKDIVKRSLELGVTPRGFPERHFLNRIRDNYGRRTIAMSEGRMEERMEVRVEKAENGRTVCVRA